MKQIALTQGLFALVDDEDFEYINQFKWCAYKTGKSKSYHAHRSTRLTNRKQISFEMHRVILNAKKGEKVDHKNRNGLDNRRENLRIATSSQNAANVERTTPSSSKYKGVHFDNRDKKWIAQVSWNNKNYWLGRFVNEADAAKAYNKKAIELHGEFACINIL